MENYLYKEKKLYHWIFVGFILFIFLVNLPSVISKINSNIWFIAASKIIVLQNEDAQLISNFPKGSNSSMLYAGLYARDRGNYDDAIKLLEQAIKNNQQNQIATVILGDIYEKMGNSDQALTMWVKAQSWSRLGDFGEKSISINNWEDAINALMIANQLKPDDVTIVNNLAFAMNQDGDFSGSIVLIKHAIMNFPNNDPNFQRYIMLGKIYEYNSFWMEAQSTYSDIIHNQPENIEAHLGMGRVLYYGYGKVQDSIRNLKSIISLNPENSTIYSQIAKIYQAEKNYTEAEKWYGYAIKYDPRNIWLNVYRIENLLLLGNLSGSIEKLNYLISEFPDQPHFYYIISSAYQKLGEIELATEAAEKSVALDANNNQGYLLRLAILYEQSGQNQQALKTIHRLSPNFKEYQEAQKILNRLLVQKK